MQSLLGMALNLPTIVPNAKSARESKNECVGVVTVCNMKKMTCIMKIKRVARQRGQTLIGTQKGISLQKCGDHIYTTLFSV